MYNAPFASCTARRRRLFSDHFWLLAILTVCAAVLAGCSNTSPPPGVVAVKPFDLQRYQGRWYELARLDHAFERDMTDVSATYTPQPDGSVRVVNRGFDTGQDKWREAIGKAFFTGAPTTGSLKVSFFGPFYGGYHAMGKYKPRPKESIVYATQSTHKLLAGIS